MACEACGAIFGQLALFEGQCAHCYGVSNARRGQLLIAGARADAPGHDGHGDHWRSDGPGVGPDRHRARHPRGA
jgi:hypothetical protein